MTKKLLLAAVLSAVVAGSVIGPAPAHAEGGLYLTLNYARAGYRSPSWTDRNSDAVSTSISHYSTCSAVAVNYKLLRERSLLPDEQVGGIRQLSCGKTGTVYFGDLASSKYHFNVASVVGTSSVYVDDLRVKF